VKQGVRREAMGGLAKGLAVIKAFSRDHSALSLSEIAAATRMPAATARRCLLTLEELARLTGDSAALSVLDGNDIVYVARTSVRTLVRLEAHVGSRFPAHVTSMGRVLLAGVGTERLDQYFRTQRFVALTTQTVTDPKKLRQLIEECRRAGYSAVEDELAYGVVAVAVPVYDQAGRVVAALNSSSHSRRASKTSLVRQRLAMLRKASREISVELARVPGIALSAQT
jgi:IclR family pca regulon transcriptional regulator